MTTPTLLHRSRLALLTTLWVLLALGPFLHAHYGSSSRTGFHLDGVSQSVSQVMHGGHAFELSQTDSPESAALGVATSHTRELSNSDHDQEPSTSASDHPVHPGASNQTPLLATAPWQAPRAAHAPFSAGLPPPAHAPPFSHPHA